VEDFAPQVRRRKLDPRAIGRDRLARLTGGLVVPDVNLDNDPLLIDAAPLPAQWPRRWSDGRADDWRRLMASVLFDAFQALQHRQPGLKQSRRDETMAWFAAPHSNVTVNLADVCAALGLQVRMVQAIAMDLVRQPMDARPRRRHIIRCRG